MTTTESAATYSRPVLYAVGCSSIVVLDIRTPIALAQGRGWEVCLILTPTAATWLDGDLPELAEATGHPVRSRYKLPGQPDVLPPPDAILVAPASSNTINKWAAGISDTLALGLVTEAIGKGVPMAAIPHLNAAQAAHPAFPRSVETLRGAGVKVLLGPDGYEPHRLGERRDDFPWHLGLDALQARLQRLLGASAASEPAENPTGH